MTAPADLYQEVDSFESFDGSESFDGLEFANEAARSPFRPGRRVFVRGGIVSATLNTPKGPARLNLPSPVPTLQQFRSLEQALNAVNQRLDATNAQLLQARRELAARKADQFGSGPTGMILSLVMQKKLRDDLEGHTHASAGATATLPTGGSKFDSLLPILFLQPGIFGGQQATPGAPAAGGGMESILPLLLMMTLFD